jgi:multisubunit Na+/H+ antiporter MnhE subunit
MAMTQGLFGLISTAIVVVIAAVSGLLWLLGLGGASICLFSLGVIVGIAICLIGLDFITLPMTR